MCYKMGSVSPGCSSQRDEELLREKKVDPGRDVLLYCSVPAAIGPPETWAFLETSAQSGLFKTTILARHMNRCL
jgi:hypothetical protein